MSLTTSAGFSFTAIKYNDHHHYLYLVPVMVTMNYELPNPGAKVFPVIGAGISLLGKADHNKDFANTSYSFTYGYHASLGIRIKTKGSLIWTVDITYNFLVPPVIEELNVSGVIVTVGVRL